MKHLKEKRIKGLMIILGLLILLPVVSFAQQKENSNSIPEIRELRTWAESIPLHNLYTISDLNEKGFTFGVYHIEGYIVDIFKCPPCPEGHICEACVPDYIVVSEQKKDEDKNIINDNEIRILTQEDIPFRKGEHVRCLIQILNTKSMKQKLNNCKLVYIEKI